MSLPINGMLHWIMLMATTERKTKKCREWKHYTWPSWFKQFQTNFNLSLLSKSLLSVASQLMSHMNNSNISEQYQLGFCAQHRNSSYHSCQWITAQCWLWGLIQFYLFYFILFVLNSTYMRQSTTISSEIALKSSPTCLTDSSLL